MFYSPMDRISIQTWEQSSIYSCDITSHVIAMPTKTHVSLPCNLRRQVQRSRICGHRLPRLCTEWWSPRALCWKEGRRVKPGQTNQWHKSHRTTEVKQFHKRLCKFVQALQLKIKAVYIKIFPGILLGNKAISFLWTVVILMLCVIAISSTELNFYTQTCSEQRLNEDQTMPKQVHNLAFLPSEHVACCMHRTFCGKRQVYCKFNECFHTCAYIVYMDTQIHSVKHTYLYLKKKKPSRSWYFLISWISKSLDL